MPSRSERQNAFAYTPVARPALFGATGSLGGCVCRTLQENGIGCVHLGGAYNHDLLEKLVRRIRPLTVSFLGRPSSELQLAMAETGAVRAMTAAAALSGADCAFVASRGLDGFEPAAAALRMGLPVVMGNKETVVAWGACLNALVRAGHAAGLSGAALRAVDSEHSAAAALLHAAGPDTCVRRLIITGTGGAVRDIPQSARADLPPSVVLRHPVWRMGAKITVDSATLMNKAFEVVEASVLFGVSASRVDVLFDRTASVHAALETEDGRTFALIGPADMTGPVRMSLGLEPGAGYSVLSGSDARSVLSDLDEPDATAMRTIGIGRLAAESGGCVPMVMAAADEAAVDLYLKGILRFGEIPSFVETVIAGFPEASILDGESAEQLSSVRTAVESRVSTMFAAFPESF